MFSAVVCFSHPWSDFLLLIDEEGAFLLPLPSLIYPYKLLLRDEIWPLEFRASCLTRRAPGTDMPAPIHTFTVLCGNSMTQLFSRLLASRFPHPPGPLGDFKVGKGQRAEIHSLGSGATVANGHIQPISPFTVVSLSLRYSRPVPLLKVWIRAEFDFHSFGRRVRSEAVAAAGLIGADRKER